VTHDLFWVILKVYAFDTSVLKKHTYTQTQDNMFREIRTKENGNNQLDQFLIGYSCNVSPDVVTWKDGTVYINNRVDLLPLQIFQDYFRFVIIRNYCNVM
jgi:hypothetical protein